MNANLFRYQCDKDWHNNRRVRGASADAVLQLLATTATAAAASPAAAAAVVADAAAAVATRARVLCATVPAILTA
eukprot:4581915-Pleurochrysis_carterae.AAC.1